MNEIAEQQWRRIIVLGTVVGFVTLFLVVFGACLLGGVTVGNAAGVAIIPAVQGSWFYGGTVFLLRAAYGDGHEHAAAPPVHAHRLRITTSAERAA